MKRLGWILGSMALAAPAGATSFATTWLEFNPYKRLQHAARGEKSPLNFIKKSIFDHLNISGQQIVGIHLDSVSGDTTAYDQLTNYGQGGRTVTNTGSLNVAGSKVLGLLNFNYTFADSRDLDPASHRLSLNYSQKGLKVDAGDIYASMLGGNQFANFNRQLKGVSVQWSQGPFAIKGLDTVSTSTATTVSFNGNNSPGPYYLQTSQLIADSVRVQVDGRDMRFPDDFRVDAIIGSITFNTLSVAPTSTIVVSYEAAGVNSANGKVIGIGGAYSLGPFGRIGLSMIKQTDPLGDGLSQYVDRYQGYGDPSIPYILQYQPVSTLPITVTLDGVVQIRNVDYQFSSTNPTVFYFLRYVPDTSTVTVTYTPAPSQSLRGDRQVSGFDYSLPFGKLGKYGNLNYSQAFGKLSNQAVPLSGTARALSGEFKYKNFRLAASVDDVPPGFVGIQSTTFQRNEKSTTASAEYKVHHLTFTADGSNSAITAQSSDSNGGLIFQNARTTRLDGGVRYAIDNGLNASFDQQHLTALSSGGPSRADISTLTLSKNLGRLVSHFNIGRTQGFGPISNGVSSSNGDVRLNTFGWSGSYDASRGWTFGGRTSISKVSTNGVDGTGQDVSATLNYRSSTGILSLFETSYAFSNSGEIATLGSFQDGLGFGYGGNGFTAGYNGSVNGTTSTGFNAGGTDVRRWNTSAAFNIANRLSLSPSYFVSREFGSVSTNSDTTGYGLAGTWDMHNNQRMTLALDGSRSTFSDDSRANSLSLDFSVNGHPKGPWNYAVGLGTLLSSGGTIAQNSFHYLFSLRNLFRANQAIGFDVISTNLTNYEPQTDFQVAAVYEYRIFRNMAIVGKYQIHNVRNLDPTVVGGAYAARGFDVEMNFNFSG